MTARIDFETTYQGEPPPWDTGAPQPEVIRLLDEGAFRGAVLDVGCGTGENALLLAARGLPVTGVDGAPTAIARAREKAAARGLEVPFLVADKIDISLGALTRTAERAKLIEFTVPLHTEVMAVLTTDKLTVRSGRSA